MDESVRQFRKARQRASEEAQDFLSANPGYVGVIVVRAGVAVRRDQSGNEVLLPYQSKEDCHAQPV